MCVCKRPKMDFSGFANTLKTLIFFCVEKHSVSERKITKSCKASLFKKYIEQDDFICIGIYKAQLFVTLVIISTLVDHPTKLLGSKPGFLTWLKFSCKPY